MRAPRRRRWYHYALGYRHENPHKNHRTRKDDTTVHMRWCDDCRKYYFP